ncbi:hypothetical protein M758_7G055500, partial [Ceratodon purpureus]
VLWCRQCIGTTDGPARAFVPMHMSLGDLPYKDNKVVLKKEWGTRGPEYYEVNQGVHHMKGYTGHTHGVQHVFAKTYGQTTRELRQLPAEPSTSAKYINYAENRPLVINEFELKHPMRFPHNVLLKEGEGTLGPLPEG